MEIASPVMQDNVTVFRLLSIKCDSKNHAGSGERSTHNISHRAFLLSNFGQKDSDIKDPTQVAANQHFP